MKIKKNMSLSAFFWSVSLILFATAAINKKNWGDLIDLDLFSKATAQEKLQQESYDETESGDQIAPNLAEESNAEGVNENSEESASAAGQGAADYRFEAQKAIHQIKRVTVFSDQAQVTRVANLKLKSGLQWVHFEALPMELDRSTIKLRPVGAPSGGLNSSISQVVIEESFEHAHLDPAIQIKLTNLKSYYGEVLVLLSHQRAIERSLGLLSGVSFQSPFKAESVLGFLGFTAGSESIRNSLDEISLQASKAQLEYNKNQDQIRSLNEKIEFVLAEIKGATSLSDQKWMLHVYCLLDSKAPVTGDIELSYNIPNAWWHPVYDLRAELNHESATADIRLVTGGFVEQHTGENWEDVKITLSTVDPAPLYLPKLERWAFAEKRMEAEQTKGDSVGSTYKQKSSNRAMDGVADGKLSGQVASNERDVSGKDVAQNSNALKKSASKVAQKLMAENKPASVMLASPPVPRPPSVSAPMAPGADMASGGAGASAGVERPKKMMESTADSFARDESRDEKRQNYKANVVGGKGRRGDRVQSRFGGVLGSLEVSQGDSVSVSPQQRTAFPMAPLEQIFPALQEAQRDIASVHNGPSQFRAIEPQRLNQASLLRQLSDSTLPAVQARGRKIEFTSPFSVSLKNDEPPYKMPVHSEKLQAKLKYFAIPKNDSRVFLRAEVSNSTSRPLLAGNAQIFMDGDLVSKTELNSVSEGSFFRVDLGADQNVETKRIVNKKSAKQGVIFSNHVTDVEVKLEIANHHPFPIQLELEDNYPLSPNDKIEVTMVQMNPKPVKSEKGLVKWLVTIPGNQKSQLGFTYKVAHPENFLVSEFN